MCTLDKNLLESALEKLAFKKTIPFCYSCYAEAPTGRCSACGSDDLMRLLPGSGVEWGTSWVICDVLNQELEEINTDEVFEDSVSQCYDATVKVGWIEVDTTSAIKQLDPVSWDMAKDEWITMEDDEGNVYSPDNGSTYYWTQDVADLLRENDIEIEGAA